MQTEILKTLNEMTFQAIENWKKLSNANLKICENAFHSHVGLVSSLSDILVLNGEDLSQAKDVKEIVSLQVAIAQETSKLLIENALSAASLLAEAGEVYGKIYETALKSGAEHVKPANSSKAQKAAA